MDKDYFIKLTTNLYRLTLLFPKKEPLRYKVRGLADEILADLVLIGNKTSTGLPDSQVLVLETKEKLEVLNSYLELAKSQNWVSPFDVLEIQKEYSKIQANIAGLVPLDMGKKQVTIYEDGIVVGTRDLPSTPPSEERKIEEKKTKREVRQEKILNFLKEKGKAQVGEIKKIFPGLSKRTLRRDFEFLLKQGIVERIGEKNNTFYQLRGRT